MGLAVRDADVAPLLMCWSGELDLFVCYCLYESPALDRPLRDFLDMVGRPAVVFTDKSAWFSRKDFRDVLRDCAAVHRPRSGFTISERLINRLEAAEITVDSMEEFALSNEF